MQFGKMFLVGAAACVMVFGTFGCAYDEPEMFKIKPGDKAGMNNNANGNLNGGDGLAGNNGDADLTSGKDADLNGGNNANAGVGSWGENKGLSPYDDFGTPIAGLEFQPVFFRFDQSIIDSNEAVKLDQVASYLQSNPGAGVVIEGHCDNKGSDEYNRALGERRALASKEYLVGKGIADSRIRTVSYGEEKPAGSNDDEASRAKNRRDEFIGVTLKK